MCCILLKCKEMIVSSMIVWKGCNFPKEKRKAEKAIIVSCDLILFHIFVIKKQEGA